MPKGGCCWNGFKSLSSASADGIRSAKQEKRHVAAKLRGQRLKLSKRQAQLPEPAQADERGSGIGRAARKPGGDRDAFLEPDVRAVR